MENILDKLTKFYVIIFTNTSYDFIFNIETYANNKDQDYGVMYNWWRSIMP